MLNTMSKIRGQVKNPGYPQAEGLLGECMNKYGRELGEDTNFGKARTCVCVCACMRACACTLVRRCRFLTEQCQSVLLSVNKCVCLYLSEKC